MTAVELNNVSKSYSENKVFDDFSFAFEKSKTYCVMGRSGCGKTTLLNLVLGVIFPDSGTVSVNSDKVSAVFQEDRLCETITAFANVYAAVPKSIARKDIEKCLSELGLSESVNLKTGELSGGMKRRVAIARALLAESDIVLLDEPFKGLDSDTRIKTVNTVLEYTKGKTVIFATHDISEAELMDATVIYLE